MDLNSKKIVFIDLDGTLIKTKSGSKFPKGVWDMDLNLKVFEQLKKMQPSAIFIVSNQGGIQLNLIPKQLFVNKFMYILSCVQEFVGGIDNFVYVAGQFCEDNNEENEYRKPNTKMLYSLLKEFSDKLCKQLNKEDCIMIGDTSGLIESYSDCDLKTAKNFGIDYIDVKDFENADISDITYKIFDEDFNVIKENLTKEERDNFKREEGDEKKYTWAPSRWIEPDKKALEAKMKIEEEQRKNNKGKIRHFDLRKK